jgi:hypothetical protein
MLAFGFGAVHICLLVVRPRPNLPMQPWPSTHNITDLPSPSTSFCPNQRNYDKMLPELAGSIRKGVEFAQRRAAAGAGQ